jgi:glycine/D-amino acid oxidase-like deaminating enzyme
VDGIEGAYMATAHNCWGILWSPVTGEIITQLITQGKSEINIAPFSPTRFMKSRTRRGRKMRDENVGEQW